MHAPFRRIFLFFAFFWHPFFVQHVFAQKTHWIWSQRSALQSAPIEQVVFRKSFDLRTPAQGEILITADNGYVLYVNGRRVGTGTAWERPTRYEITPLLATGKNTISVMAENESEGPAGLAVSINIKEVEKELHFDSDASWKWSKDVVAGWYRTEFDDQAWISAVELGTFPEADPWKHGLQMDAIETVKVHSGSIGARGATPETGYFRDRDRVVLIGSTNIERMQGDDYFESWVTSALPQLNLSFRNIGWSGDDVWGTARAVFGRPEDGFARLERDLFDCQPTLIIVSYGLSESFAGASGLDSYKTGLRQLFQALSQNGAPIIFVSPTRMEKLGGQLPDPAPANENLSLYVQASAEVAQAFQIPFIDLFDLLGPGSTDRFGQPTIRDRLTDNQLHFNQYGHWRYAPRLAAKLGVRPSAWKISINALDGSYDAEGMRVEVKATKGSVAFTAIDDHLPYSPPPPFCPRGGDMAAPHDRIAVVGLLKGNYGLNIDDRPTLRASESEWAAGVYINRSLFLKQSDELRAEIHRKNELFFHRYRPQNETYLFLFRKHEQGNNAVEIPQFDPLINQAEINIQSLKKPVPHKYELRRLKDENIK